MFGHPQDARIMWERSLEIEPTYIAYSNLGALDHWEGRFQEAAEMYEKALKLDDSDYRVWGNLAGAYYWTPGRSAKAMDIYEKAISMAREKLAVNPNDYVIITDLTEYYSAIGDIEKADSLARRALSMTPDNWDVLMRVGAAYEMMGNREKALELLKRSLKNGGQVDHLKNIPELQKLREDPRYQELIQTPPEAVQDTL
jgi:tetratricopeptide (TPR) repeat protein